MVGDMVWPGLPRTAAGIDGAGVLRSGSGHRCEAALARA